MSKHCFLDDSWGKVVSDTTGRFCLSWNMLISMQSSSNPSEDWSEHLGVGMYALMMIKDFGCIQSLWETCISKEVSGSTIEFLMSICCWHINDQKWRRISGKHIGLFGKCFQWKTWIKLLEHWASRSIRIDQKLNSTFKWAHALTWSWRCSRWISQRRSSCLSCKVWS